MTTVNSARIRRVMALTVAAAAFAAPATAATDFRGVRIGTGNTYLDSALDVAAGSLAPGAKVVQNSETGAVHQRWDLLATPGGYRFVNQSTGFCLTTNGLVGWQLYVTFCNDANPRQTWTIGRPDILLPEVSVHAGPIFNPFTQLTAEVLSSSRLPGTPVIAARTTSIAPASYAQHFGYLQLH